MLSFKNLLKSTADRTPTAIRTAILRCLSAQTPPIDDIKVDDNSITDLLHTLQKDPGLGREIFNTHIPLLFKSASFSTAVRLIKSLHTALGSDEYNLPLAAAQAAVDPVPNLSKPPTRFWNSFEPSAYLSLAKAFSKCDDPRTMLNLVTYLSNSDFPDPIIVINRIIFAFAESGQSEKALFIFSHLKKHQNPGPDLVTFNIVFGTLGRTGRVDEMLSEFSCMKESRIVPDVVTYNTVLNSLRKMGMYGMCSSLFKEMGENGIEPDLRTFTAVIESTGRSGNIEESLRLFHEMKSKHIRPSIYIFRSLIDNIRKMGKAEVATELLLEMNSRLPYLVGPKDFKSKSG